jgi:glycyl-tRNA synthetase beta chain
VGFATKQGIDPSLLSRMETPKGTYAGFERKVEGKTVGQLLADELPSRVVSISFAKTMRWGSGDYRWVRPVHWIVALHGKTVLPIEVFGIVAGGCSVGHRFLGRNEVKIEDPGVYAQALEEAFVVVDSSHRRRRIAEALGEATEQAGGVLVPDDALLAEVSDLVEWPGVVQGKFDEGFLKLPRELLMTTLRHHQKSFSVESSDGVLLPVFLAVANTDRDPEGHVRRGNEWVVSGRLGDAAFFWGEDRKAPLEARSPRLDRVVFHAKLGTFLDKARRMENIAGRLCDRLSLDPAAREHACRAAYLSKNDLVTSTVGEFPELQGQVGGLLLAAEGAAEGLSLAIYEHYRPTGADDALPSSAPGCIVSVADRLDTLTELIAIGEKATGSRDPFGLRRAATGLFRIVIENRWPLSMNALFDLMGQRDTPFSYLGRQLHNHLRDRGFTPNEVNAVLQPGVSSTLSLDWPLYDIISRLEAIRTVRARPDFNRLVELTKRVDNLLRKESDAYGTITDGATQDVDYQEAEPSARDLAKVTSQRQDHLRVAAEQNSYLEIVEILAGFVAPVDRFFEEVLVMDPSKPEATAYRWSLIARLRTVLTQHFDIRELAGQADRRQA